MPVVCTGSRGFPDDSLAWLNGAANLKGASVHFLQVAAKAHGLNELHRIVASAELLARP
jgi:hypothetical protein